MSIRVTLYTKPGCHLCEDALRIVEGLQTEFDLTIESVDIADDRELFKRYFDKIPVLLINNRVTLAAPIRLEDVRAALMEQT